jgi:hypothetical protein|tara:strand:- start:3580 stop:3711 length:132 start_codon:yes stop_codon:yes gene_type:complete
MSNMIFEAFGFLILAEILWWVLVVGFILSRRKKKLRKNKSGGV